ncbi:MAG: CHAT domain-containing protein [Pirellulales bacterium]
MNRMNLVWRGCFRPPCLRTTPRQAAGRGWATAAAVLLAVTVAAPSRGQERGIPSRGYWATFGVYREGDYKDALESFQAAGRGAIKTPQSRWIDSICYHAMVGECYYHMGRLEKALDHYTSALQLYSAFSDWMIRVQFPPSIRPAGRGARPQIPWGQSTRRARVGHYPRDLLISQGRIDNKEIVQKGGVVQQAMLKPINVQEIIRCTTLAMRRRARLLGPVTEHDTLTQQVLGTLLRRPGPPNHWSEAWIDVQLGLALMAAGKDARATQHLQRGLVAAGQYDHAFTGIALLELGRLALHRGDMQAAAKFFEEATYSAVYYSDYGVLREAFHYGTMTHILSGARDVYPPLAAAAAWAKRKGLRRLEASLLLDAVENCAALEKTGQAAGLLDRARSVIGTRDMSRGYVGARLSYLAALGQFQQGHAANGEDALTSAVQYLQHGSLWLLHIRLADRLYTGGKATARTAMELYSTVLRDPQPTDWSSDPMESMAVLLTPHPAPIERWFEVALQRKEHEKAMEISDRMRRHRFFSSLPFGGRLQSLRWILEGPPEALDDQSQLLRKDLLMRYPRYAELARAGAKLRQTLRTGPAVPEQTETRNRQREAFEQLAGLSTSRETILRQMALRREPASLIFPPLHDVKEIQQRLPDGTAVLAFFATSRHLYAFLINDEHYAHWPIRSSGRLRAKIVSLLRELGQYAANKELKVEQLADDTWKGTAEEVLRLITEGSQADFTQPFDELIIVPDGLMWYVPFEALQVRIDGRRRPLIARFNIRYVPTVSLAVPWGAGRRPSGTTGVVVGKLFPRDEPEVAQAGFNELARVLPGAVALPRPLPAPAAAYSTLLNRLIVLDDLPNMERGPLAFAPLPTGRARGGDSLSDWLALPFGGPDEVILPGYHTAAERALKDVDPAVAGQEMFLTVCGLMSSGVRTALLSRWRTGGQSSFAFVREFAQELPHTTPAEAYRRAVFLTAGSRIDPDREPRVRRTAADALPQADHAFFWAGYMLVDSGAPKQEE